MSKLTILNDIHSGAIRAEGTTTFSQLALRLFINAELKRLLPADGDLMILGDLFDTTHVPMYDLLAVYESLYDWLAADATRKLYNARGNHDASKTSNIMSSFDFLGSLLSRQFPQQYVHIDEAAMTPYGYVIPHCRNQDLFNMELALVPECDYLFLHCNVDNNFAAQSDQSLNISLQQVQDSKAKLMIVAHEHHSRLLSKVVLPGNQIPSSIADWLSKQNKRRLVITDGVLSEEFVNKRDDLYLELDWKNPVDFTGKKFIRIVGSATAEEAAAVVTYINSVRKQSDAFVVGNAVHIESEDMEVDITNSLEAVQSFSIMGALKEAFTEEEFKVLEKLNA